MRVKARIASGTGRYSDPWHPFAATSARVARTLEADGWQVEVDDDVDHALASVGDADLLVVNAADPWRNGETGHGADPAATRGLDDALDRGLGVLAVHNAVSSLRDYPRWRRTIGGEWVPGRTWHPPLGGQASVEVVDAEHPVTAGLTDFTLADERYTDLEVDADNRVLVAHTHDGVRHPLVWVREVGASRVVVDVLGHDERSFDAVDHLCLIQQAARWIATPTG